MAENAHRLVIQTEHHPLKQHGYNKRHAPHMKQRCGRILIIKFESS
jgi:hypothetical protein